MNEVIFGISNLALSEIIVKKIAVFLLDFIVAFFGRYCIILCFSYVCAAITSSILGLSESFLHFLVITEDIERVAFGSRS